MTAKPTTLSKEKMGELAQKYNLTYEDTEEILEFHKEFRCTAKNWFREYHFRKALSAVGFWFLSKEEEATKEQELNNIVTNANLSKNEKLDNLTTTPILPRKIVTVLMDGRECLSEEETCEALSLLKSKYKIPEEEDMFLTLQHMFDKEENGKISKETFKKNMKETADIDKTEILSEEELNQILEEIEEDANGCFDITHFIEKIFAKAE